MFQKLSNFFLTENLLKQNIEIDDSSNGSYNYIYERKKTDEPRNF